MIRMLTMKIKLAIVTFFSVCITGIAFSQTVDDAKEYAELPFKKIGVRALVFS